MFRNTEPYQRRKKFYQKHIQYEKQCIVDLQEMLASPYPQDIPIAKKGLAEHKRKLDNLEQRLEELTLLEKCIKPLLTINFEN